MEISLKNLMKVVLSSPKQSDKTYVSRSLEKSSEQASSCSRFKPYLGGVWDRLQSCYWYG